MNRACDLAARAYDVDDGSLPSRAHFLDHRVQHVYVREELGIHRIVPSLCLEFLERRATSRAG